MEPRFGHDFKRVRVHSDERAAESARAVNAEAYTVGQHIVFGAARYSPTTADGQRLLAHELAHTLQQENVRHASPVSISSESDPPEQEAEAIAARALRSEPGTAVRGSLWEASGGVISRAAPVTPWVARQQTPWPAWHQEALAAMARIGGKSGGPTADQKWPALRAYLCQLPQARGQSLYDRLGPSAAGLLAGTDDFAVYVKSKFPQSYGQIITILQQVAAGNQPPECEPPQGTPEESAPQKGAPQKGAPEGKDVSADPSVSESNCRIDVRAVAPPLPIGRHLFIVARKENGVEVGYRGGPDTPGGLFGLIVTDFGRYEKELFPDWDPSADSVTVLSGPSACGKTDCFADKCLEIDDAKIGYRIAGPNSNSVVSELLTSCGVPRQKPDVFAPGWDTPLFSPPAPREGGGGQEGASGVSGEGQTGMGGYGP